LIEAADLELADCGSLTGRFEAVARRAGVSRATAYRQLGSIVVC
jgi:AcrR family transcriptional regulator